MRDNLANYVPQVQRNKPIMMKKIIVSGTILLVIAVGSYFLFFRGTPHEYDFRFDAVSRGDLTVYVTATGNINPVTSVDVGTQISGIVSKMYADFNSVVRKGQVIAQIDPTFLIQAVKDAEAGVQKAQAQLADSKRALDRQTTLLEKHLDSQINYDAALTTFETNSANLKSAQASLDRAKINLSYATIYAPINGVVINRAVNVGQTVAASFSSPTLYTIANDLSKMQVLATIDESDIGRISVGQEAGFTVDAYENETFDGVVSQIRLASVTTQNVVNYTVVIDVNNNELKLMPGMTASVKILVASMHDVLRVPNMALRLQPPVEITDTAKVNALKSSFGLKNAQNAKGDRGGSAARSGDQPDTRMKAPQEANTGMEGSQSASRKEKTSLGKPGPKPATRTHSSPQFGIELRFPEYQKSEYVPSQQSGRGRIWILNKQGLLEPVAVRTGLTDGRYTQVTSSGMKAGDQIVLGATPKSDEADDVKNPLTPSSQPDRRMGGRGPR